MARNIAMLSVANKPIMLNVVILSVIMLSVVAPIACQRLYYLEQ